MTQLVVYPRLKSEVVCTLDGASNIGTLEYVCETLQWSTFSVSTWRE